MLRGTAQFSTRRACPEAVPVAFGQGHAGFPHFGHGLLPLFGQVACKVVNISVERGVKLEKIGEETLEGFRGEEASE